MISELKFAELIQKLDANAAQLVAVSKTRSREDIHRLYRLGQRHFGENRVQEMQEKQPLLPADIHWHLIGHLQRNKVKYIADFVHLIHSVDSARLLQEIQIQGERLGRVIPVLLQVHIAQEKSKFGWNSDELHKWLKSDSWQNLNHVEIRGLMGMATLTSEVKQVRSEFSGLKKLFEQLKGGAFSGRESFSELSMGMSGDWELALEEGATILRIGSMLFKRPS